MKTIDSFDQNNRLMVFRRIGYDWKRFTFAVVSEVNLRPQAGRKALTVIRLEW